MTHNKPVQFPRREINKWDIAIIIIAFSVSLFITLKIGDKTYDDAYITFRYAKNLAAGYGFVYNPGENYLGTTTPLFTLLLATLKIIFPGAFIPSIAKWLTGGALFAASFFTYLLGQDNGKPVAGVVSTLLVLLNPIFVLVWGGESIFFLALVIAAVYLYFRGGEILPAIFVGLAFLTRGEGILPGVVLFLHYAVTRRKLPWRAVVAFLMTTVPWIIYSLDTFGTPLPGTLQAKMAQMDSGVFPPFFITSLDMFRSYLTGSPNFPGVIPHYAYFIAAILAFLGGISLLFQLRQPIWWAIMAWLGLYAAGYSLLDVPFYHWYSIPLLYGGIILTGLGVQSVYNGIIRFFGTTTTNYHRAVIAVLILVIALPLIAGFNDVRNYVIQPISQVQKLYSNTGRWLQKNTPATASIGYFEIGFMGYFSDRKFVDPVGLVNFGVSEQVARRDFKWAYLYYKPDYLVINPVRWYERIGNIKDEHWFDTAYQEVTKIEEDGYFDAPIIIYRKINTAAIPSPDNS